MPRTSAATSPATSARATATAASATRNGRGGEITWGTAAVGQAATGTVSTVLPAEHPTRTTTASRLIRRMISPSVMTLGTTGYMIQAAANRPQRPKRADCITIAASTCPRLAVYLGRRGFGAAHAPSPDARYGIHAFARSMLTALRHPAYAGQQTPAPGARAAPHSVLVAARGGFTSRRSSRRGSRRCGTG
jgi:hypothetical protein